MIVAANFWNTFRASWYTAKGTGPDSNPERGGDHPKTYSSIQKEGHNYTSSESVG